MIIEISEKFMKNKDQLRYIYPSIIMASKVTSPSSSGSLPSPTEPSHLKTSHLEQPFSTTSITLPPRKNSL